MLRSLSKAAQTEQEKVQEQLEAPTHHVHKRFDRETETDAGLTAPFFSLQGHNTAVSTLHSVVHDTHVVMADWEVLL